MATRSLSGNHRVRILAIFLLLITSLIGLRASGPYPLTITIQGSGNVVRNPNFERYPAGSVVTLTANPASDWLFSHWSGDLTGNSNPANVQVNGPLAITAHFVENPTYALTTSVNGQGTLTLNPPGGSYRSNSVVQITASPTAGWTFANWTGDASGSANPLSVTMDHNHSITANFAELVAISVPPANVATNSGSTVTFTVQARGTGPFSYKWSFGNSQISGASSSTLTVTNVQPEDEGAYTVTVTGPHNSTSASAQLTLTDGGCDGPNVVNTPSEAALRAAIETGGYVRLCFNGTITLSQPINIKKNVALDATARQARSAATTPLAFSTSKPTSRLRSRISRSPPACIAAATAPTADFQATAAPSGTTAARSLSLSARSPTTWQSAATHPIRVLVDPL